MRDGAGATPRCESMPVPARADRLAVVLPGAAHRLLQLRIAFTALSGIANCRDALRARAETAGSVNCFFCCSLSWARAADTLISPR
ncbi:hypothetical protein KCP77_03065 [Salmonella enterica subsp. enterica]|nr:hypothetical protein KCP77_03065 [Salmonella enterica subsp. enterica]